MPAHATLSIRALPVVWAAAAMLVVAAPAHAAEISSSIRNAVADPGRPEEDRQRDANRKPAETLAFAGIKSGDRIVELFPNKGYFTRMLSKVVGDKGSVLAVVPPKPANAPADRPEPAAPMRALAADPNYKNVSVAVRDLRPPQPADVVWTTLNYHDAHNASDIAVFNKAVFDALKPGGIYIVVDHAAAPGSGARDTPTLHRIDPETVKAEVAAAGFVLDGESDALHNAQDAHTIEVHDPAIRWSTDQFMLKFRKPAK